MNVMEELAKLIREVFDAPDAMIDSRTTASDVDGWDSLSHVNLIVSVEERFGVKLPPGKIGSLRDVGDLSRAVEEKLRRP